MNGLIKFIAASLTVAALLLSPNISQALLEKHDCGFCHSLHGSDTGFVPRSDSINLEVLCMGCHLTANGSTAAVQPHRTDGTYAEHYITCSDCHDVHDNQPNWRLNDPNHVADDNLAGRDGTDIRPDGWPVGVNTKMLGRQDPDGETPYAIIITKEKDFNKDGVPDRGSSVTQTCNASILNDCYVSDKRHVIFENRDTSESGVTIHSWADNNEDGMSPADAVAWGETITEFNDPLGAPMDGACNMCHTQTNKNACGYVGAPNCGPHQIDRTCTDCHTHAGCFDKSGVCTKWTMPDRDVRMDTVSAAPTSVDVGQTVTITADFTNLGTVTEVVRVKFYSSIENYLGFMDISDVAASGGTGQAIFNWDTAIDGTHEISAEAQPVLGEVIVANNTATGNTVTVNSLDRHDIAVTSVSSPSPIHRGDTKTVSVELANIGTYTEGPFDVTLTSDRDGLIGTLSSGTLTPGATPTLNFSWNTTGASLGTHLLTAAFATFTDDVPGNDTANTTAVVAIHDVAVTSVSAPASTDQGLIASVDVDIANLSSTGGFSETFNVTLYDNTDDPGHAAPIGTQSSGLLAAQGSTQLSFNWDTTGASIATHTLEAIAETVAGETITANNSATTTAEVVVPAVHDVEVTSVSAPATVDLGTSPTITVRVTNNGDVTETFNVTLSSDLDGQIQVLSSGSLPAGNFTDLSFTWSTGLATSLGVHTLTAVADTVPGETNTVNNTGSTTTTTMTHDLAITSVTDTPDPAAQGGIVNIQVTVENQGNYAETFDVTLTSDQDGLIHTWTGVNLGAGATTVPDLIFNWDTTGATAATHTLTANITPVSGELDTADNSGATTNTVNSSAVHDVAITLVNAPPSATRPTQGSQSTDVTILVTVENQGTVSETFDVTLTSNQTLIGNLPQTQPVTLSASGSTVLNFTWTIGKNTTIVGTHILTATAATVPGETDTADNSSSDSIVIN